MTLFEAIGVVAGFEDVTVMGESVEQGGGHFGIPEDLHPFPEAEIGGHDQGGFLIQRADEMEQQRATAFGERQIAEFIENHRVDLGQAACARSGFAELLFLLQLIDEIDDVIEPDPVPGLDGGHAEGNGEMGFISAIAMPC